MENMKTCTKCKVEKTATSEFFVRDKHSKDGFYSHCKTCTKIYMDTHYLNNKKEILEKNKIHYQKVKKYRLEKTKSYQKTIQGRYTAYKHSAKQRSMDFGLTFEEFSTFWKKPCTYCSSEISTIGLDRVNSLKGYTLENCISCCEMCNIMKLNHTLENFLSHISKIYNHALANTPSQNSLPAIYAGASPGDNLTQWKPVPLVDQFQPLCVWSSSQSLSLMYND